MGFKISYVAFEGAPKEKILIRSEFEIRARWDRVQRSAANRDPNSRTGGSLSLRMTSASHCLSTWNAFPPYAASSDVRWKKGSWRASRLLIKIAKGPS